MDWCFLGLNGHGGELAVGAGIGPGRERGGLGAGPSGPEWSGVDIMGSGRQWT